MLVGLRPAGERIERARSPDCGRENWWRTARRRTDEAGTFSRLLRTSSVRMRMRYGMLVRREGSVGCREACMHAGHVAAAAAAAAATERRMRTDAIDFVVQNRARASAIELSERYATTRATHAQQHATGALSCAWKRPHKHTHTHTNTHTHKHKHTHTPPPPSNTCHVMCNDPSSAAKKVRARAHSAHKNAPAASG